MTAQTKLSDKQPEKIKGIFSSVASGYDRANDVLSLGIHKRWKKLLVKESSVSQEGRHLDLATGTGDVAFLYEQLNPHRHVVGLDFSAEMLSEAAKKKHSRISAVEFVEGDILALPFEDDSFDSASFAFGVRNVADVSKALSEIRRVLRPGSPVGILEFGRPESATLWGKVFSSYQTHVLPIVGGWVTGDADAYRYLDRSSKEFPSGDDFLKLMETAGMTDLKHRSLSGGIAYLYSGQA